MDAVHKDRLRELEERSSGVLTEAEAFELENLRTTRLLEATGSAPDNGEYLEHTIDYGYHPRPMSEEAELRFQLAKAQRRTQRPSLWQRLVRWFQTGGKR